MDQVLVRVTRNLTDMREGDQAWVDDTPWTAGMVAGGYMEILDRRPAGKPRRQVKDAAADQAESD